MRAEWNLRLLRWAWNRYNLWTTTSTPKTICRRDGEVVHSLIFSVLSPFAPPFSINFPLPFWHRWKRIYTFFSAASFAPIFLPCLHLMTWRQSNCYVLRETLLLRKTGMEWKGELFFIVLPWKKIIYPDYCPRSCLVFVFMIWKAIIDDKRKGPL